MRVRYYPKSLFDSPSAVADAFEPERGPRREPPGLKLLLFRSTLVATLLRKD